MYLISDDDFTRNYIQTALATGSLREFSIYQTDVNELEIQRIGDALVDQPVQSAVQIGRNADVSEDQAGLKWTNDLIKLLLSKRLELEWAFNRPTCKKKKLWRDIGEEISKLTDISVSGEACDIKYRNLLATYRINKKKNNQRLVKGQLTGSILY